MVEFTRDPATIANNAMSTAAAYEAATSNGSDDSRFRRLKKAFQGPEAKLRWKLDSVLLVYVFVAGILKEMDQDATTQAYVTGMKEDLKLNGNELVWFQTYFSIAYAICIVPAQIIQTKVIHLLDYGGIDL